VAGRLLAAMAAVARTSLGASGAVDLLASLACCWAFPPGLAAPLEPALHDAADAAGLAVLVAAFAVHAGAAVALFRLKTRRAWWTGLLLYAALPASKRRGAAAS